MIAASGAAGGYWLLRDEPGVAQASSPQPSVAQAEPADDALTDPLRPGERVPREPGRALGADWVSARPLFQTSRPASERGGVEPCATQQVDASALTDFAVLGSGRLTFPRALATATTSEVDLIVHLHGEEPVRRELAESGAPLVLATYTLGPDQGYAPAFAGPRLAQVTSEVEQALSGELGRAVRVRKLGLSAWSAGFTGVAAVLAQPSGRKPDAVALIDGLHAPRADRQAFRAQLAPFLEYARQASAGEGWLLVSHSSIDPPDFASTTETAHYLIAELGGSPELVRQEERYGLQLVELFRRGDLQVRGYAGNDKPDHCAQLALLRDVYAELARRWATPPLR